MTQPTSRRKPDPSILCPTCGDEAAIIYAGRRWCAVCDPDPLPIVLDTRDARGHYRPMPVAGGER